MTAPVQSPAEAENVAEKSNRQAFNGIVARIDRPHVAKLMNPAVPTPPVGYLVDWIVTDAGMTALAFQSEPLCTRAGVWLARSLLQPGTQPSYLAQSVRQGVGTISVITTSESTGYAYLDNVTRDGLRLQVVTATPWDQQDGYWQTLRELTEDAELVIIDHLAMVAGGALGWVLNAQLGLFECPVVALYVGNDMKPGMGSMAGWGTATGRFWFDARAQGELHAVGRGASWPAVLPLLPGGQLAKYADEGAQVRATAELARQYGHGGMAIGTGIDELAMRHYGELASIWGHAEHLVTITNAIERNRGIWDSVTTLRHSTPSPPAGGEPPF